MPTREEMRSLAGEIVRSHEDRIAGIAQIRETVKADLKEFLDSRTAVAKELRADLAKSVADRKVAVSTQLKDLDAAHAAMSRELNADLAKIRPALAEEERKRQNEAREFRGELGRAVAEGKAGVKACLREFDSAHNVMSREMRAGLARGRQALAAEERKRQTEARQFKGGLTRTVAEGKAAARARLKEFADIQAEARDEWQTLTASMEARRAGGVAVAEAPPPLVKEVAEEEAMAPPEAAKVTPRVAALRDRVFEYLANHPDGTRLVELEQEFGLSRVEMARVVRGLMDENKVEKRDLLYFAI